MNYNNSMNFSENSTFGRRVFFVNPPHYVTNTIIPRLTASEYEVYSIDTYKMVKAILRKYPDSICFINIDCEELSFKEWFNFVQSFNDDPVLSTIFFGVISQYAPKPERENFLLHAQIPAGFIQYTPDMNAMVDIFTAILEINGAMGKRKYIRADCGKNPTIYADIEVEGKPVPLLIQNISSVGLSCYASEKQLPMFQEKSVHRMMLHLRGTKISGSVIILMCRNIDNQNVVIMLFSQGLAFSSKTIIREFVRTQIQKNLDEEFLNVPQDEENYSVGKKRNINGKAIDKNGESDDDTTVYADDPEDNTVYADDVSDTTVYADDIEELEELEELPPL